MHYLTPAEAIKGMDIELGYFRLLLRQGRVKGAKKVGRSWVVPKDFVIYAPSQTSGPTPRYPMTKRREEGA